MSDEIKTNFGKAMQKDLKCLNQKFVMGGILDHCFKVILISITNVLTVLKCHFLLFSTFLQTIVKRFKSKVCRGEHFRK